MRAKTVHRDGPAWVGANRDGKARAGVAHSHVSQTCVQVVATFSAGLQPEGIPTSGCPEASSSSFGKYVTQCTVEIR
jgi:hypothetical protein